MSLPPLPKKPFSGPASWSERQHKALAIVPKFTALLSMIGAIYIIQHICRSEKRRRRVFHRILCAMTIMDLVLSFNMFLTTWPIPSGRTISPYAAGTDQTCRAVGFFVQGSLLSSALYNAALTTYYFTTVQLGWPDSKIRLNLERWLHLIPLVIGWTSAIVGILLNLYGPTGWTCWITTKKPTKEGMNDAKLFRWTLRFGWLYIIFIFVFVAMVAMYMKVHKNERITFRFTHPTLSLDLPPNSPNRTVRGPGPASANPSASASTRLDYKHSRQFAVQALFYILAYFLTFCIPMILWEIGAVSGHSSYAVSLLTVTFSPMQGFWNALIYIRPRYLRYRKKLRAGHYPRMEAVAQALSIQADGYEEGEDSQDEKTRSVDENDARGDVEDNDSSTNSPSQDSSQETVRPPI